MIAPDYPGYGHSSMPTHDKFAYTFDNLAKVIDEFTEQLGLKEKCTRFTCRIMVRPVGYRLAAKHPDRITAIVVQNGNAYDEGLDNKFWQPIKEYWKQPSSMEKRNAIRNLLTYDATKCAVHRRRQESRRARQPRRSGARPVSARSRGE